eukprot:scaffold1709_cov151-Skeletonema_menzelii.AAC.19
MKITQASIQTLAILGTATATNAASLRGRKRTRDPDHMVAYKASQSSLVPPAVASSHPHEGQKRTRDPDYMVAYAASEAADRVSKRARIGDGNSKGQPEQSHAAIPGWGQN